MFVVTNREVFEGKTRPADAFGSRPNPLGPNELRLAQVQRRGRDWHVQVLPDEITDAMATEVGLPPPSQRAPGEPPTFASRYVARKVQSALQPEKGRPKGRNLLFFVHGFNNDMPAVLDRAEQLAASYDVEVIPFSWPANGGGFKGVASYKSDKRDALASTGALDRAIARLGEIVQQINAERVQRIEAEAEARFGGGARAGADAERWDRFFTAAARKECPFKINMMLHSMGNYVYKHLLGSSTYGGGALVFDNVLLVAADTNNAGHAEWVDRIQCRGRVFVTLNERDAALAASRMKMGEQQLARLGHWPHRLDSRQAVYVDFTDQPQVTDSHAYFEGRPLRNAAVKRFFDDALNGEFAEARLSFDMGRNMYRFA
jgi:hypothetical protein